MIRWNLNSCSRGRRHCRPASYWLTLERYSCRCAAGIVSGGEGRTFWGFMSLLNHLRRNRSDCEDCKEAINAYGNACARPAALPDTEWRMTPEPVRLKMSTEQVTTTRVPIVADTVVYGLSRERMRREARQRRVEDGRGNEIGVGFLSSQASQARFFKASNHYTSD